MSLLPETPTTFRSTDFIVTEYSPRWQAMALIHRARFDAEKKLEGRVYLKVWGMAFSPAFNHIATCISLHPSEAPEYPISSDFRSIISISETGNGLDLEFGLANGVPATVTAEAMAFTMKYLLNQCPSQRDKEALWANLVSAVQSNAATAGVSEIDLDLGTAAAQR
jgi:hypothetical protein